jgi:hypothetical protein
MGRIWRGFLVVVVFFLRFRSVPGARGGMLEKGVGRKGRGVPSIPFLECVHVRSWEEAWTVSGNVPRMGQRGTGAQ